MRWERDAEAAAQHKSKNCQEKVIALNLTLSKRSNYFMFEKMHIKNPDRGERGQEGYDLHSEGNAALTPQLNQNGAHSSSPVLSPLGSSA